MTLKVMSWYLNGGAPLLHGAEWKEHLVHETTVFCKMETAELHEKRPQKALEAKVRNFILVLLTEEFAKQWQGVVTGAGVVWSPICPPQCSALCPLCLCTASIEVTHTVPVECASTVSSFEQPLRWALMFLPKL